MVRKAIGCALIMASALSVMRAACAICDASQPTRTPSSRYVINGAEVYDKKADLTWQRCSIGQRWRDGLGCVGVIRQMTWQEAMSQASGVWRMPTNEELSTLISPTCENPAINEYAFPDMELTKLWYWSSSESGASAWYVAFGGGSVHAGGRMDLDAVRLVRSGR